MPLTIIGLGPGPADDITRRAWTALQSAQTVYLRTRRHPCVPHLPAGPTYHSFDEVYETTPRFEDVYTRITETLLMIAAEHDVVYAVPGDPFVAESTVAQLIARAEPAGVPVTVHNGVSFIEPTCAALEIDALDGLQLIDGLTVAAAYHPPINPAYPALLAQVYNREVASHVKLTLMNQYPDDFPVVLVHGAGAANVTEAVALYQIDRSEQIDHLTSLYVPAIGEYSSFETLQAVIAHLRAPEGCPWDRKQTHASLRPYLIEETYEVLDTINQGDTDHLAEELGDLLLQIVLHTQIATEDGEFYMSDVLGHINAKMIRRHPHVWGDSSATDAETVVANWDAIKQQEQAAKGIRDAGFKSVLADVPDSFTALMRARAYARKAAKAGFDYPDIDGVRRKIHEELAELDASDTAEARLDEAGDLLFAVVDLLRWLDIEPEVALQSTNSKFARRFQYVERRVYASGKPMSDHTPAELDRLWEEAKQQDKADG
jgi:tetrapyrrole methylase family protein / MazG family protein